MLSVFAVARIADDGHLFSEDGNLVGHDFKIAAVGAGDLDLFHDAVVVDVDFRDFAVDGAGLGDGFRAENADVCVEHGLKIAGLFKRQDALAAGDGEGVAANGDDGSIGKQLYAAVPVLVLDGDSRHRAPSRVNDERLADAQLAPLGDADNGQPRDFHALFRHEFVPPDNRISMMFLIS